MENGAFVTNLNEVTLPMLENLPGGDEDVVQDL